MENHYPTVSRKVLVLGESSRSTLAVVRSLGRAGIAVDLGLSDADSPAAHSRYVREVKRLASEKFELSRWLREIEALVGGTKYDLLIPTTEGTFIPIIRERLRFEAKVPCALPASASFEATYDKRKTVALAGACGVPIPKTRIIGSLGELEGIIANAPFPLVIKPAFSKIWEGDRRSGLSVKIAFTAAEAQAAVKERLVCAPVLVQEHLAGIGVGQEFLCSGGAVIDAFQHNRIREPSGSGGSSYRVSAPLHPKMLEASRRLIEFLKWDGVLMIEYRWDERNDSFGLIEINGRFWGSLPLAVAAGADFPLNLYHYHVNGYRAAQSAYRTNIYGRDVFADMRGFLSSPNRSIAGFIREYGGGLWRLVLGREHWDAFALDDLRPGWVETFRVLQKLGQAFWYRFKTVRLQYWNSIPFIYRSKQKKLAAALRQAKHILIFCFGNINRSPFAQACLRSAIVSSGRSGIEVRSAGYFLYPGRKASGNAIEAARRLNVSLTSHVSRVLSGELAAWADVIFCMDARDFEIVKKQFPGTAKKLYFLNTLALPAEPLSIPDPYGKGPDFFAQVFERIKKNLEPILQRVSVNHQDKPKSASSKI